MYAPHTVTVYNSVTETDKTTLKEKKTDARVNKYLTKYKKYQK